MTTAERMKERNVGIIDGQFCFSDDKSDRRKGFLMLLEHLLTAFAESLSCLESEGFIQDEAEIRSRLQRLYDQLLLEYNFYVREIDTAGRFVLDSTIPA